MQSARKYLLASIGASILFLLTMLLYAQGPENLSPILIGIVAVAVIIVQAVSFFFSVLGLIRRQGRAGFVVTMLVNAVSAFLIGVFFAIWWSMVVK